ncbi:MAG: xanthine dehydrogenase family protein molybdopterin-binding subunit [Myxococcota bacterium]|jgi:carbon-monoxide dehydrogenase large subunit|nr:xanthine dehydrogenase family protein molybdopterin-binding subunit [Myxococcota bacterium]
MKSNYIGTSAPRIDAVEKVTGEARFVADLHLPGMVHAKLVRSPHAHARIVSIDTNAARAMPGVLAVVTGADMPWWIGECVVDQRALAVDKVRYPWEGVAAVIAETEEQAILAADKIKVEYELLPAVIDVRDALKADAPLIHPDMASYHFVPNFFPEHGTNVFHHYTILEGDAKAALASADVVLEQEYEFPLLMHAQLETHGCVARQTNDGRFELYASCQSPFMIRTVLAEAFHLPRHMITVRAGYIGGGFGGKSDATIEPLTCALARFVPGRWVRFVLSREENLAASVIGRGLRGRFRVGANRDGKLVGAQIDLDLAAGAYGWTAINIVPCAGNTATGPYHFPTLEIHTRGVYTNTAPVGAYRGYGHPDSQFMMERHMDLLARALDMDPVELRLKNIYRHGEKNSLGQRIDRSFGDLEGCINAVAKELGMGTGPRPAGDPPPDARKVRGVGLACLMKAPGMATNAYESCLLKFNEDGTVHVISSFTDMGQGTHTGVRQIAADIMELPLERVYIPRVIDTDFSPYDWQTVASRSTWMQGRAIAHAWKRAKREMIETCAAVLGVEEAEIEYENGVFFVKDQPERALELEQVCHGYVHPDGHVDGGPVVVSGYFVPYQTYADPTTGQGNIASSWTFGCQGAEIEVDLRTGELTPLRIVTALDVGRVINPTLANIQVVGGVVFALGGVLSETTIHSAAGAVRNPTLTDYKVPTPEDCRDIDFPTYLLETPVPGDPVGTRCIAEHPSVAVAPALVNALSDAAGVEFYDLPLSAERVLEALTRKGGSRA